MTMEDDGGVHICARSDALRKRQFTMNIFVNSGIGEKRDGFTIIVCKGKGKEKGSRKTLEEWLGMIRHLCYFEKNAWVNSRITGEIARHFLKHVKKIHGGFVEQTYQYP